jgi:excisionase family DNA binding protein
VTPDYRAALLITAKALPPDCVVSVPAGRLLELLAGSEGPAVAADAPIPDFTIAQVAQRFGREPSTVRGWIASGHLTGSYHFRGRERRIPLAAVLAFEAQQQRAAPPPAKRQKRRTRSLREPDLSGWRRTTS